MRLVRLTWATVAVLISLNMWRVACGDSSVAMSDIMAPVFIQESPENEALIVKLPDGSLRLFYTLQPSGSEMRSITSTDGGLSWGDSQFEVKMPGQAVWCMQAMLAQDGELHAFVLVRRGDGRRHGIDLFLDVWHWKTTGGRAAWTSGRRIFEGVVGAMRGVTQLRSGRIVLPVGMWLAGRKAGLPTGAHEVSAMYSDDNGETWQMSPSRLVAPCYDGFNGSNYGACEPNVVELEDDHVWMLMRTQTGFMYESHSHDGGANWSDAVPSDFISSDSPAEVVRVSDGRIIVLWHNGQNPPRVNGKPVAGGRDALHAAISEDNGATWRGCREIYRDPLRNESPPHRGDRGTAYSTGVMNDQGKVVLCTGQGEKRRAILIFDPAWLLATHHEDDFSNGLDGWCAFTEFGEPESPVFRDRVLGPEVIDHPSKEGAHVLHLRRPQDKPGDGAVWNFPVAIQGNLKLRLMLPEGFGGANLALCDRFYNPGDYNGERFAIFGLPIDSGGKLLNHGPLDFGRSIVLEFRWDLAKRQCEVSAGGEKVVTLPMLNTANKGISYLRIRSTAETTDSAGMLIENVSMDLDKHVQSTPIE
ncbi:MAG: sialidase family protein [Pirellulales bacterium]